MIIKPGLVTTCHALHICCSRDHAMLRPITLLVQKPHQLYFVGFLSSLSIQHVLTTYSVGMATPTPVCPECSQPMTHFIAQSSGRPYTKCYDCDILRAERDTRIPNCNCGMTAKLRTARTQRNYGRKFRGCGKAVSDTTKCDFFVWA
jgi:transposase-like protein